MPISTTHGAATVGASSPYHNQVTKTNGAATPAAPTGDALTLTGAKKSMATVESRRSRNTVIRTVIGVIGLAWLGGLGYLTNKGRATLAILWVIVIGDALRGLLTKKSA